MRIVNDRIYIDKGETPTYDVNVIDRNTGAPFVLPSGIDNPVIEFVVRQSIYDRKEDFVFKCYITYAEKKAEHDFGDTTIQTYTVTGTEDNYWDNDYGFKDANGNDQPQNALFRKEVVIGSDEWEYRYYNPDATGTGDDYKWIPYEFKIIFPFPYEATSLMEAKVYKYEVVLFGADITPTPTTSYVRTPPDEAYSLTNISYKKPLLSATDFIVGGSLSE